MRPDSALVYDLEQQLLENIHTEVLGPLQVMTVENTKDSLLPFRRMHMGTKLGSAQWSTMGFCTSRSTLTGDGDT